MRDSRRATLSQFDTRTWYRTASLRSVQIVLYNESRQTMPSVLGENALISFLFDSFPLFFTGNASFHSNSDKLSYPPPPTRYLKTLYTDNCDGAETLDCTLSQTNFLTLPPSPVFENSPYRQLILINDAYSRWSTGNRGRATSTREVIEVAGSNHAIGVILNLAWGPNNFSPSMIWSLQTRSNSQTGLGAE